jgi:hypothetical protein
MYGKVFISDLGSNDDSVGPIVSKYVKSIRIPLYAERAHH